MAMNSDDTMQGARPSKIKQLNRRGRRSVSRKQRQLSSTITSYHCANAMNKSDV